MGVKASEHPGNLEKTVSPFGGEFEGSPVGKSLRRLVGAQRTGRGGLREIRRRVPLPALSELDHFLGVRPEHLAGRQHGAGLGLALRGRDGRQLGHPEKRPVAHFVCRGPGSRDRTRASEPPDRPSIVGAVLVRAVPGRATRTGAACVLMLAGLACAEPPDANRGAGGAAENFVFPAEFEPQRALWMAWPTYENKRGLPTEPLLIEIIRAAENRVEIELLAQDADEAGAIRARLREEDVPDGHVTIRSVPHGDVWVRDMGPIFLRGDRGGLRIADFGFNMWGYESPDSPNSRLEEAVDRLIAEQLGLEVVKSALVSEGGSREFNGRGTMIAVEAVEKQRNPGWTLDAMDEEFRRVLGVSRVIWLAEGMAEDELTFRGRLPGDVYTVITTGGHVDEFARFADPETILLAEVTEAERRTDPIAAISYERLEESFRRLSAATDQDGNPFRIVRVPVPDSLFDTMRRGDGVFDYIQPLEYEDGSRIDPDDEIRVIAAASYLNFQVTNGLVLAQKYWKPGMPESLREKDERALAILREVFPGREVLPLDAMAVNLGGGGIHCILQQEPRRAVRGESAPDGAGP